jgi:hypothetical protein
MPRWPGEPPPIMDRDAGMTRQQSLGNARLYQSTPRDFSTNASISLAPSSLTSIVPS